MENYFVVTIFEGEEYGHVMTESELAHRWETEDIAGIGEEIRAWSYSKEQGMQEIDVYETVQAYLKGEREQEQEYRDYCETVNEYGYDYYENQDNLEIGFDPYAGCYTDDC